MAPNSEESGIIGVSRWEDDTLMREKQRPPVYNPEDYASSLKKWARKHPNAGPNLYTTPSMTELDRPRSQSNSFRDYRNPMLTPAGSEMTLRQFGTVSELLSKLKVDLRLAYPSFIQEFVSDPHDGVTLLLELLRAVQLSQGNTGTNTAGSNSTTGRVPPSLQRRALLDELTCLQCLLCCCVRYSESIRRLATSSAGLFTLAVCIMSNVNKSRIIALQLLTKSCEPAGNGHTAVSEAMSTLRLRFGEPVRFRFLVGMLISAGGQGELLACGIKFINTFLDTSGNTQKRLYIQAELEQAGLDMSVIKKIISINSPFAELVFEELDRWNKNHIDVDNLMIRVKKAEKQNDYLRDKLLLLERRVQILQEEKGVLLSLEQCLKERCSELQDEVTSLKSGQSQINRSLYHKKDDSTPAEDEGISSSERSLTPEDIQKDSSIYEIFTIQNETATKKIENRANRVITDDEETTIDDVIQELKNIVNDVETEAYAKEAALNKQKKVERESMASKIQMRVDCNVLMDNPIFDSENEIVPSNLHPQPPRRTRSLIHLFIPPDDYDYNNKEIFFENETPYTSDEGSDSLLSASKCHFPRVENPTQYNNRANIKNRTNHDNNCANVKKSESFHHVVSCTQIADSNKNRKSVRHNSVDGYQATNFSKASTAAHFNHQRHVQRSTAHKMMSKSLDRIDDGLDTMVDIVMTNQQSDKHFRFRPHSDSGNTTMTNSTPHKKDFKISKLPSSNASKNEEKHKIFLPSHPRENHDEIHYYFPRIQEKCNTNNNFVIKRGHTNAGMYSGFHIIKNDQSVPNNPRKVEVTSSAKNKNQSSALISKVTDSPSGLY